MKRKSQATMQAAVDKFNERHPVGSTVTVIRDLGEKEARTVLHPATILSGHTPVVWLEGIRGCYILERVVGFRRY